MVQLNNVLKRVLGQLKILLGNSFRDGAKKYKPEDVSLAFIYWEKL